MLNLTMIMQCIYIYVKIIFVHPVSGVSIYRSKCNENSYKTKKKPQVAHVNTLKIYLLDLDCHIICDIFTSTFNILLEAAFKRKKRVPWWRLQGHQCHLSAAHLQWSVSGVTQSASDTDGN